MKAVVKQLFRDAHIPGKKYFPGEVVEFDNDRAAVLIEKGLIEKQASQKEDKPADETMKDENVAKSRRSERQTLEE